MKEEVVVFWFRRDLRLHDNVGLNAALASGRPVLPLFIFDTDILDKLEDEDDARVNYIWLNLKKLDAGLRQMQGGLLLRHGVPLQVFDQLCQDYRICHVYANEDFEPYGIGRDSLVRNLLQKRGAALRTSKDHVIFSPDEILKDDGNPYIVFTPYSKRWLQRFQAEQSAVQSLAAGRFVAVEEDVTDLKEFGFRLSGRELPEPELPDGDLIREYHNTRNIPSIPSSRMGLHLRFGTISIRQLTRLANSLNPVYLNELIWREFFMQIMFHFPRVADSAFRAQYDFIRWRDDPEDFSRWCEGRTGYPLVDAGMRELRATGFMHNRVRMVTASFLCKHLLIDWRWGEAWFARHLLDFELSSNNGNWQWAAGTGCDAAPYFRVFNPAEQARKFDPDWIYIRRWVPEWGSASYAAPMVEHAFARERAIRAYREALASRKD